MSKLAHDAHMTPTATPSIYHVDLLCESGFAPTESIDNAPAWVLRSTGAIDLSAGGWLLADYRDDTLTLTLATSNGVIYEQLRFNAPDGEVSVHTLIAFHAVVSAWC